MTEQLPQEMRALVLDQYHEDAADAVRSLKIVERPVPSPGRGQVLVRMQAAPCNPSDLLLLQGKYGRLKTLPTIPGWEGTGRVIASGGGVLARWLNGRDVACGLQEDRDGTWAQYFLAKADECVPLSRGVPGEQAACLIINPLTAMGLLDTARRDGHRAAVQTAAASQVGQMILAMAKDLGFPLINVVRRKEQVRLLRSLGADLVIDTSDADYADQMGAACEQLGATAAFEAVAGEATGEIINVMPPGSHAYVYGALSEQPCGEINPIGLIFERKRISGFYLGQWLEDQTFLSRLRKFQRVQRLLQVGRIKTRIQTSVSLDEAVEALLSYVACMTDGKVLILPNHA